MEIDITNKLEKISRFWNNYVLEYSFFDSYLLDNARKSNYLNEVLAYFQDTLSLVFNNDEIFNEKHPLANYIVILQSIYIQQDLIDEISELFKIDNKENNESKNKNREIRNDLIHVIRRNKDKKLTSSNIFSYESNTNSLSYTKYKYTDNEYFIDFEFHNKIDIINRHREFLNIYLDKILHEFHEILSGFQTHIQELTTKVNDHKLTDLEVIDIVDINLKNIFLLKDAYSKKWLTKACENQTKHQRYQNLLNEFRQDTKTYLKSLLASISNFTSPSIMNLNIENKFIDTNFEIEIINSSCELPIFNTHNIHPFYYYELGKITNYNQSFDKFKFELNILKLKIEQSITLSIKDIIWDEIHSLEKSFNKNKFEYYVSLHYLEHLLQQ